MPKSQRDRKIGPKIVEALKNRVPITEICESLDVNRAMVRYHAKQNGLAVVGPTHCKRGHPMEGYNLLLYKYQKFCRTCQNAHARAYYAEHVLINYDRMVVPRGMRSTVKNYFKAMQKFTP